MILSIIIPTKNEEEYLPQLLRSIKKQTFEDYEIIVADNESKDKTQKIAKKYNCLIVKGGLPGIGRNLGAKKASGEMLLFLDADTELEDPTFLELLIAEFKEKEIEIAVPKANVDGKFLDKFYCNFWNKFVAVFQYSSPFAGGWCIFIKRDIHNKIKGFNEKIVLGEDSDYVKRAARVGKFRVLKSTKIKTSPRRLHKEGYLKIIFQSMGVILCWIIKKKDDEGNRVGYSFDIYK